MFMSSRHIRESDLARQLARQKRVNARLLGALDVVAETMGAFSGLKDHSADPPLRIAMESRHAAWRSGRDDARRAMLRLAKHRTYAGACIRSDD